MTREEAVAIAGWYVSAKGVAVTAVRTALYFTGEEYGDELDPRPGPSWAVYYWLDDPPADPPENDMSANLCINVDVATGVARAVLWL